MIFRFLCRNEKFVNESREKLKATVTQLEKDGHSFEPKDGTATIFYSANGKPTLTAMAMAALMYSALNIQKLMSKPPRV